MKALIVLAALLAVALTGCASVTPQQAADLTAIGATTGAVVAGVIKPSIAIPASTIAGAVAGGATAAAAVFPPLPPTK